MRALKYFGIGVGVLLALLLVAIAAIALLFDPNDYKPELQQAVERRTGRTLQLPGRLELSWYPSLAIEAGPAALGNAPGFGAEPLLEIGRLRLGVRVADLLLRRRLAFDTVRLERPVLRLATAADGRDNWSDLVDRLADSGKTTGTGGDTSFAASISGLRLGDASIEIRDARDASRLEIAGLAVETGALRAGAPFDLDARFMFRSDPASAIEVVLRSRVALEAATRRARLESPEVALRLRGSGWPTDGLPATLRSGPIEIDLAAQTLRMPRFELESLGARVSGDLAGTTLFDAPRFTGPVRLAETSAREWLRQAGIALPAMRDPKALGSLAFEAELNATPKSLELGELRLRLDGATLTGRFGIPDLDAGHMPVRFDLDVDRLDLDRYLPPESAAAVAGSSAAASPPFALPVELLRTLDVVGQTRIGRTTLQRVPLAGLRLGIDARDGRVRIDPLAAALYGGSYRGKVAIDAAAAVPRLEFEQAVDGIDFGPLLVQLYDTRRFTGRGSGTFSGSARGADVAAWKRSLAGRGTFAVADGAIQGADLWYEIRRARALLRQEAVPSRPAGAPRTPFTRLRGSAQVVDGAMRSDDLAMELQYLRVAGRGRVALADLALDGSLDATVLKIPGDAADMREAVDFTVPVRVTGTLDSPTLRPDVAGLAKARLEQEVEKRRGELENKVKDRLKDLFKR